MSGSARWAKRGLAAAGGLAVAVVVGAVVLRRLSTSRFGPRQANTYLIVGLGDSVPAGTAAGGPDFLRILGETAHRETGRAFRVLNLAVPGLTVRGLMRQLRLPGVRQPVADADAVVVTIGANDFSWPLVRGRGRAPGRSQVRDAAAPARRSARAAGGRPGRPHQRRPRDRVLEHLEGRRSGGAARARPRSDVRRPHPPAERSAPRAGRTVRVHVRRPLPAVQGCRRSRPDRTARPGRRAPQCGGAFGDRGSCPRRGATGAGGATLTAGWRDPPASWRREWDSNPRNGHPLGRFQGGCTSPLCDLALRVSRWYRTRTNSCRPRDGRRTGL